jgi:hypothetical protein
MLGADIMAIDKKFYQMALDVQDACNLSGVVYSFKMAMEAICEESHQLSKGTEWKNKHPICVLFSTQIGYLTGTCGYADHQVYMVAVKECEKQCGVTHE